jgi:hypothetical protein
LNGEQTQAKGDGLNGETIAAPVQSIVMPRGRRSCRDRERYAAICELRSWRDALLRQENDGVKRRMISSRPEVERTAWDWSWTTYVDVRLTDGFELSFSSGKYGELSWPYEDCVAVALYRVLRRRLVA